MNVRVMTTMNISISKGYKSLMLKKLGRNNGSSVFFKELGKNSGSTNSISKS